MKKTLFLTCFLTITSLFAFGQSKDYLTIGEFSKQIQEKIKKYPGWSVYRQGNEFVFLGPQATIVESHKNHEPHPNPDIERQMAEKKFPRKSYELKVNLDEYPLTTYRTTKETNDNIKAQLKGLQEKHGVGAYGVYQDEEKGLYAAENQEEKNRLAKYFLEKKYLETQKQAIPDLYIVNYGVEIDSKEYYRVYPKKVHYDAVNIQQMVRNILEYGDDEQIKKKN